MIDLGMREFMEPQGGFLVLEVDKRWVAHFNECRASRTVRSG